MFAQSVVNHSSLLQKGSLLAFAVMFHLLEHALWLKNMAVRNMDLPDPFLLRMACRLSL